ncbi:MAG: threonine synthase [Parvibaculales bacterium]
MKYVSTRGQAPILDFEDALLAGLALDGGLYVPESWPRLSRETLAGFQDKAYADVAFDVLSPFLGPDYDLMRFREIVQEAYACFADKEVAPLVPLGGRHHLLELFHGPTMAFKDVAMQLLARLMDDALTRRGQRATIVGATSGDTGGAAIEAFRGRDAIDVFILYPEGRVSDVQRKQMTTPTDANVHAVAVQGTFDDCQALVKSMFNDVHFRDQVGLAGVNSINWARVMAQTVYYFTASAKLTGTTSPVGFSVPTGNFGDIFAGYVAAQMGLPVAQLMIATNVNDILARVLSTGVYAIGEVVATASPSMDIQVSSNFERLLFEASGRNDALVRDLMKQLSDDRSFTLPDEIVSSMREQFDAVRVDQGQMADVMNQVKRDTGMIIDPHTAIGVGAAWRSNLDESIPMVTLATAHPAKFPASVEQACGEAAPEPQRVTDMMRLPERTDLLPDDLAAVQDYISHKSRAL